MKLFSVIVFTILITSIDVWSQDNPAIAGASDTTATTDSLVCKIVTNGGTTYIGTLLSDTLGIVTIDATGYGIVKLDRVLISTIEFLTPAELFGPSTTTQSGSRYFLSASGYGLREGEGYYQNIWITFNQAAYGITDNISVGVGLVPLFLFGQGDTPVWVTTKVSVPIGDVVSIGAGVLFGTIIGTTSGSAGFVYGVGTIGNRENSLSVSLGYGLGNGEFSSTPLLTISGMVKFSGKSWIMTENYIIQGSALSMIGFRTVFTDVSLDYGLAIPFQSGSFIALPLLGVTIPF